MVEWQKLTLALLHFWVAERRVSSLRLWANGNSV